jgi:recombination protein RecA
MIQVIRRPTLAAEPQVKVFPTGSTLLDLQNGGGWALGRMINVVGDSSSGKTLLAIEACANFARLHGVEHIRYCETEAAFDESYARKLGLPKGIARTANVRTAEDFNDDLSDFLKQRRGQAALYCIDSADALSSQAESARDITDKSTYGAEKAKVFSEMFRRQAAEIGKKNCCLFVISQTRDNIGSMFVPKTRSGGNALDFYATQIVWLHEIYKEKRTVSEVERVVGINVRAQNKKNKIGPPFREVEFLLIFDYGIDDELSMIKWLKKNKAKEDGLSHALDRYSMVIRKAREQHDLDVLNRYAGELRAHTRARWIEIEEALKPRVAKYL